VKWVKLGIEIFYTLPPSCGCSTDTAEFKAELPDNSANIDIEFEVISGFVADAEYWLDLIINTRQMRFG
jgi:hypothetical protein